MKKVISLLLVVVILCSTFAGLQITSSAATLPSSGSCGANVTYTFDSTTGLLTISGSGAMKDYSSSNSPFYKQTDIQTVVIENDVTTIGEWAFIGCSSLTGITIHNSVTSIGSYAFQSSGLTSITIPDSVISIGEATFRACSSLTSITIPNSVTSIGSDAFYGTGVYENSRNWKNGLLYIDNWLIEAKYNINGNIAIDNGTIGLAGSAFEDCRSLTSITIPNSVTSIGNYAFYRCSSLTSITIPNSVTSIGDYAFCSCSSLTSITIPNSVTNIGKYTFSSCKKITKIKIPDSVTSIDDYAFCGCSGLTSVTIPDFVTNIGYNAFEGCSSLTSVTIPNSVTSIGNSAFSGCSGLISITIPDSVISIGDSVFFDCRGLKELTMPCSAKIYNSENTFKNCTNIEKITLTKGIGAMQNYASLNSAADTYYQYTPWYIGRNNLKEIVIEDGVKSIGDYVFCGCSGVTSITIPDSVTSIGSAAFSCCSGLTSITIPHSVTNIGSSAFSDCRGLISVTIPNFVTSIGDYTFSDCSSLTSITIPDSVISISNYTFQNCSSLTSITIPDSVISISNYTFQNCSSLTSITIPDSVTSIGDGAFIGCRGLTEAQIGNGVQTITKSVFSGCSNLKTVEFGSGIQTIEKGAFSTPTAITLPVDKMIDFSGFENCANLQIVNLKAVGSGKMADWSSNYQDALWFLHKDTIREINLEEGIETISESAFNGCSNLIKTNVPSTVKSIGKYAYAGCSNLRNITINSLNCIIPANENTIDAYATIYGYENSTAKAYAEKYNRTFVNLGEYTCQEHMPVTDAAIAPTCLQTGLTEGVHCAVCSKILEAQQIVLALGHDFEVQTITDSSCIAEGLENCVCKRCDFTQTRVTEKSSHQYSVKTTEPTCISKGFTVYTCENCGDTYRTDYEPATDTHEYKAVTTEVSSCSQAGVKTYTCTICGDKYTEAIPMKAHTVVSDNAVEPTCTKYGLSAGEYCSVCGKIFETQEKIEPLGHDFGAVVTPATLTANGVITHPCSRCDNTEASEVIYAPKTFTLAKTSYVYTGKAIAPAVAVKDSKGKALVKGTDYDVLYKNNINIGTASVVITFKGNYEGTKTLAFTILPKATNLALAGAKKAFTAKWTKVAGVTGYQIQYAINAKFTVAKAVTVKGAAKYAQAVKNLKGGAKYYVRIRTYKTVGGKNYFSTWSAAKAVTTKK
ncbi:MAG: leucine-rich repeat domain-containing protein [Clostridia bacterium]|nr:leucine-rich repeat domain-containing protein [Clostridia bacterium]